MKKEAFKFHKCLDEYKNGVVNAYDMSMCIMSYVSDDKAVTLICSHERMCNTLRNYANKMLHALSETDFDALSVPIELYDMGFLTAYDMLTLMCAMTQTPWKWQIIEKQAKFLAYFSKHVNDTLVSLGCDMN